MQYIQKIKDSSFLKHNAIFFFGSIAVGALNYAYYPVVGRLMDPSTFGELQVVVSLFFAVYYFSKRPGDDYGEHRR